MIARRCHQDENNYGLQLLIFEGTVNFVLGHLQTDPFFGYLYVILSLKNNALEIEL
jgi:hypothetical protein